jgi:uncharacterized protein YycO
MNKLMIIIIAFVFSMTTSVFAQAPAVKVPTTEEVKETLKQDVEEIKKDAKKMKDTVEQGVREDVKETKESVKEAERAVKEEVNKLK